VTCRREEDVHVWFVEQADALRRRRQDRIDWDGLAEELEDMAARDRRELKAHLKKLLSHLLKWRFQPEELRRRQHSWRKSINEAREDISDMIGDMPSLGGQRMTAEFLPVAYARAREDASIDSGLKIDVFPEQCPWTFEEIIRPDFLPSSAVRD
jgi:hypothetical protein